MNTTELEKFPESKVIVDDFRTILADIASKELERYHLTTPELEAVQPKAPGPLPYKSANVFAYAQNFCGGGNDCPDGSFPLDCTHFICHCLAASPVYVTNPSAKCQRGLCIRVNDLATAFANAVGAFTNVKRIGSHAETRRGDFCFIPSWFGLSKEHVMMLAGTADPKGAPVYAHTNNRCGTFVPFEGADCAYYRIEDA
jgi:hypothetical protein